MRWRFNRSTQQKSAGRFDGRDDETESSARSPPVDPFLKRKNPNRTGPGLELISLSSYNSIIANRTPGINVTKIVA